MTATIQIPLPNLHDAVEQYLKRQGIRALEVHFDTVGNATASQEIRCSATVEVGTKKRGPRKGAKAAAKPEVADKPAKQ